MLYGIMVNRLKARDSQDRELKIVILNIYLLRGDKNR